MAIGKNSFALFDDEETQDLEDVFDVVAHVTKKEAEKAAEAARKAAEEAAEVQARVDEEKRKRDEERHKKWMKMVMDAAEEEDKAWTRRKAAQLAKQNSRDKENSGKGSRSSNESVQSISRPSSSADGESQANNGLIVESTEPSKDAKDDTKKPETKEEKKERLRVEREEAEWRKARQEQRRIDAAIEAKQMTLEKYEEAVLAKKRKALEDKAKKLEERKVALDEEFETMHLIGKKKEDSLTVKKETEREKKSNKLKQKTDKVQKLSISEFGNLYEFKVSPGGANSGRGVANANTRNGANSGRGVANGANIAKAKFSNGANTGLANGTNNGSSQGRQNGNHKEAPPKDSSYKILATNGRNGNHGGRSGYQSLTKAPPRVEDTNEFPDLLKQ